MAAILTNGVLKIRTAPIFQPHPSVRHKGGQCIAIFWPNVVGIPIQERHLQYEWDGKKVTRYFDYSSDEWQQVP